MALIHDYSDRLNPFFVKEFREGLKAKTFVGAILLALVAFTWGSILLLDEQPRADRTNAMVAVGLYFTMLAMTLGLGRAGREERTGRKLELVTLSGIAPRQIALGIWIATVIRVWLVILLAIPFVTALYFAGEGDLTGLLAILGAAGAAGTLLAAGATAVGSMMQERAPFGNLLRNAVLGLTFFIVFLFGEFSGRHAADLFIGATMIALAGTPLALAFATDGFIHESEPNSRAIRAAGYWAFFVAAMIGVYAGSDYDAWLAVGTIPLTVACVYTVFNRADEEWTRPLARPRRRLDRILGGTGVAAALGQLLLAGVVITLVSLVVSGFSMKKDYMAAPLVWAAIAFPVPFMTALFRRRHLNAPLAIYAIIQIGVILLTILAGTFKLYEAAPFAVIPSIAMSGLRSSNLASAYVGIGFTVLLLGAAWFGAWLREKRARRVDA